MKFTNLLKMSALVLIPLFSFFSYAEENISNQQNNLKFNLNSRLRYEDSNQKDLSTRTHFLSVRLRPQLTFDYNQNLKIILESQYAKIFGQQTYLPSSTAANSLTDTSGNTSYAGDNLNIRQGYLDFKISDNLSLVGGRQQLNYGDQFIIGSADWGTYGRSFDAIKLKMSYSDWSFDLFDAQIVNYTNSSANTNGDKDLYGLYISGKVNDDLKNLDFYSFYLNDNQTASTAPADTNRPYFFGTYGTRFIYDFLGLSWKLEYAQNYGQANSSTFNENNNNQMIDTEISKKFGENNSQKISFQFFQAGKNWKELYPTTFTALGRADVVGRRNIKGLGLHYGTQFQENFSAEIDTYLFKRSSTDSVLSNNSGTKNLGSASSDSDDVGSEIDITLKQNIDKNLYCHFGLSFFQLGTYLKDSTTDSKTPHYAFAALELKY